MSATPLAELMRPRNFDETVGQEHLFGEKGVLRRMCNGGRVTNMIFYGPPGTGKTTAAEIVAANSGMTFCKLNATTASLSDVKDVLSSTGDMFGSSGILLYLDEIQYFNKKQQQSLLEYIEDGRVTLVASTTENPHFCVYNALVSRSLLLEFKPVKPEEILKALYRAVDFLNKENNRDKKLPQEVAEFISNSVTGDVRRSINLLENAWYNSDDVITEDAVRQIDSSTGNYSDDTHFDLLSALQKSIRGSDPDATAFYLMRLLDAGELLAACRRLQVIASEDIGLAYPMAAAITKACCDSAVNLGMPEARIPLANAALMLATSPKSNSAYMAIAAAEEDIANGLGNIPPVQLRSPLYTGYKYPHDFPGHYVKQQYLPDDIKDRVYYKYGNNKTEQAAAQYAESVGSRKKNS